MASSTPTSSPIRHEHNSHPYPIKTSHTGLLTRSNSSKAHGSWSRHHYIPVSPSTSTFKLPASSPDLMHRHTKSTSDAQPLEATFNDLQKSDSPQRSERSGSMSPSISRYSKSWVGRNAEGDQVKLPRHPYSWNPLQLATYLSSELCASDGQPLDSEVVKQVVAFVQQKKIGGRAFLGFDQEDFQGMEGIDSVWSNALWDASCTLRQNTAPYRPSRISSSAYKPGRVKGIVNVFERSASESSDMDESDPHDEVSPKSVLARGFSADRRRHVLNQPWGDSKMDDNSGKQGLGHHRQARNVSSHEKLGMSNDSKIPLVKRSSSSDVVFSVAHNVVHDAVPNDTPTGQPGIVDNADLAVVSPPQSGTPLDLIVGLDTIQQDHNTNFLRPDLLDDNTPKRDRDAEIISGHRRQDSEPTMAELYEQTYGVRPPSPRREQPMAFIFEDQPDEVPIGETVKVVAAQASSPDHLPTALRPVARRKASTPPRSLRHLFIPSPADWSAGSKEPQRTSISPTSGQERDEAASRALDALNERLETVERRLEVMEKKGAEQQRPHHIVERRRSKAKRNGVVPLADALDGFALEVHSSRLVKETGGEGLRTRRSTYILLVGAATGVSVVFIPLLLRHLWTR